MEWKWEMHTPDPGYGFGNRERVRATINNRGIIYLNGSALKALGYPEAVLLMYDRRHKTIGITGCPAGQREAYRVNHKGPVNFKGRQIYARPFCKDFGINPSETLVFTDATVNKDGILLLDLNAVKATTKK